MIQLTEFIVSVNFPVQMRIIFAMDDSSPLVDISAANSLLRTISLGVITNFGAQLYYNFHNTTPVIIATSPLSNALLTSPRLFKIVEIALTRLIRYFLDLIGKTYFGKRVLIINLVTQIWSIVLSRFIPQFRLPYRVCTYQQWIILILQNNL